MTSSNTSLISTELEQRLNWLADHTARNEKDTVIEQLGDASHLLSYDVCTWWDGCYYCRDQQGEWQQIKCFS